MPEQSLYQVFDHGQSPTDLSAALFAGRLVVFRDEPAVRRIVARARQLVEAQFGRDDPGTAEGQIDPGDFRTRIVEARKSISTDAILAAHMCEFLASIGYRASDMLMDRLRLRAVPSNDDARSRLARPLPVHRDTWGSRIHAQVNWWLPLYPLSDTRTMLIWPDMFDKPITNTSNTWDFDVLLNGKVKDYPLLPESLGTLTSAPVPVLIDPGTMLVFSAAHLHSSISDHSGITRFSLDTRTVWAGDVRSGRGAPNVDCARKPPLWQMFEPPADGLLGKRAGAIDNPAIGGTRLHRPPQ